LITPRQANGVYPYYARLLEVISPSEIYYVIDMEHPSPLIDMSMDTGPPTNLTVAPPGSGINQDGRYLLFIDLYFITVLISPAIRSLCGRAKMIYLPELEKAQFRR